MKKQDDFALQAMIGFWKFVYERHKIWYKRFFLLQSKPWTEDIILQEYKFTNVFRILDRGTQYLVNEIIPKYTGRELLFQIFIYRTFNRIDTYEELNCQAIDLFDQKVLEKRLLAKEKRDGESCFTKVYMTTAHYLYTDVHTKVEKYARALQNIKNNIDIIYLGIKGSKDMQKTWDFIRQFNGYGDFLSHQLCVDLSYTNIVEFDNNKFTHAGAGARRGLNNIFLNLPTMNSDEKYLEQMIWLRDNQLKYLNKDFYFNIPIPSYIKHPKNIIPLTDIQNCCCEYSKYIMLKNKVGKFRIKFKSHKEMLKYE